MKKLLGVIIGLLIFLTIQEALAKVKKPPAEIVNLSPAQKSLYKSGFEQYNVPIRIRNNTKDWLGGLTFKLYIFDKQMKKIYEVAREKASIGYKESEKEMFWKEGKLKSGVTLSQYIILPKDFEGTYGKPKYYVVELLIEEKVVGVKSQPKNFFKNREKEKRKKRIEEWKKIKEKL